MDVLDISVTRDDEAKFRTHHTEVEVNIPGYWVQGHFMMPGQRYLLELWRSGKLVHSEKGLPVGYNDLRGPPWSFGWYKYFSRVSTFKRQAYIGPVRVQKL